MLKMPMNITTVVPLTVGVSALTGMLVFLQKRNHQHHVVEVQCVIGNIHRGTKEAAVVVVITVLVGMVVDMLQAQEHLLLIVEHDIQVPEPAVTRLLLPGSTVPGICNSSSVEWKMQLTSVEI